MLKSDFGYLHSADSDGLNAICQFGLEFHPATAQPSIQVFEIL